jgi:hypothetical protein
MFGMTLSLRTYAEIFGGLAIIIGFLWFVHHERDVGYQQRVAYEQKIDQLQEKLNDQHDKDAQAIVDAATAVYKNMASQPAPPARVVQLCSNPVPVKAAGPNGGAAVIPDGSASLQITVERPGSSVGYDIRPITEYFLDRADAQITALQAYVSACQKEGFCKATVPDAVPTPHTAVPDLGPAPPQSQ